MPCDWRAHTLGLHLSPDCTWYTSVRVELEARSTLQERPSEARQDWKRFSASRFDWSNFQREKNSALIKQGAKGSCEKTICRYPHGRSPMKICSHCSQNMAVSRPHQLSRIVRLAGLGFGFVEMEDGSEAAIEALNGVDFKGRALRVNEAQSKQRPGGGGGRRF